jgi:hypothetical protein
VKIARRHLPTLAIVALALALLALAAPLSAAEFPAARVGWLVLLAAGLEVPSSAWSSR